MYKCKVSFRIFDLTWLYSCKRVIGLVWNIKWMIFSFCTRKLNHKVEFLNCILYLKMPDFRSSKGPCPPWTPTRSLPWTCWGRFSAPRPPDPQLHKERTCGHCISCLRHDKVQQRTAGSACK